MMEFYAWMIALLVAARPSGHEFDRACIEAPSAYEARVASHVDAAMSVAFDDALAPILPGIWARYEATVRMLAVAHHESMGFCRAVDTGEIKGDSGASMCAMGIMTVNGRADEFPAALLLGESGKASRVCYVVGYRRMGNSFRWCRGWDWPQLRVYASGSCSKGGTESRDMTMRGNAWWAKARAVLLRPGRSAAVLGFEVDDG